MNALPGERWQYNSGGVILIAAAVRRLTGVQFDEFASTHLFRHWYHDRAIVEIAF